MRYFLACCVLLFSLALLAQRIPHPIVIRDILPAPYVTAIAKDKDGFMWIGTTDGLCRYDGSMVVTFRHEDTDPNSLTHDFINCLLYDSLRDILWIGTDNGLSAYMTESHRFRNPQFTDPQTPEDPVVVKALCLDHEHQLWFSVSSTGLATYHFEEDTVTVYPVDIEVPEPMQVRYLSVIMDIEADPSMDGILWLGTGGGLLRFDIPQERYVPYFFLQPDLEMQLYCNQIRIILPLENGMVCVAPWSRGLMEYIPDRKTTEPQLIDPKAYRIFNGTAAVPPLFQIDENHVLYNTEASCILDLETLQLTNCISMQNQLGKAYGLEICLIDSADRKWGASEYGLHLFDPISEQISNYQFQAEGRRYYINGEFIEDTRGHVIIVYENSEGAYDFDPVTGTAQSLPPITGRYLQDSIFNAMGVVRRPNGQIWVLERHKLYRVDTMRQQLIPIDLALDTLPYFWASVEQESDGSLWLGTGTSGLVYFNPATGALKTYRKELETGEAPTSAWLSSLLKDSHGNLWIRKEWGYSVYQHDTDAVFNFNTYQHKKLALTHFIEDHNGNIWAGYEGGLFKMSSSAPELGVIESIGLSEGLAHLHVQSVAEDNRGYLWMLTPQGLQKYDPVSKSSWTYDDNDGMIMHDERFNRNPSLLSTISRLSGGRMAFAPRAGFSIFYPDSMHTNTEIPRPYIRSVTAADSLIATDLFANSGEFSLPFEKNDIAIECSAIAYSQSQDIRFEYHLGNAEWKVMQNHRVQFSSLAPGEYPFYFRAVNSAGVPSPVMDYSFRIHVPWWRTWCFLIICISGIVAAVWFSVRHWKLRYTRIQRREHEVQVLMASLESRALRNQMNPHFLFNIFNNIQELILTGNTERAYTYTTKFSKLLRMILDNARKDEVTIEQEYTFLRLYLELESLRFDDAFTYSIDIEQGLELMHIPVFIIQPLVENAIRHGLLPKTSAKSLGIVFRSDDDRIICEVTDNGVGLNGMHSPAAEKDRDHALQLVRHRLTLQDGASLTVQNRINAEGVVSRVSLPMKA